MEVGTKNILIVCHGFPPNAGVGGRRWAKFAKYLKQSGYNVLVLASKNSKKNESEWNYDIKDITVEYLPSYFPEVMTAYDHSFFDKFKYRIWLIVLKILNSGNFYDRSFFWKIQIKQEIKKYVKLKKIDTIIVTSGPFILSYYVTRLKKTFPEIKFITDFRDLWTSDSEITSFSSLSIKRIEHEKKLEKSTVEQSDYIFTVGEKMSDYFLSLSNNKKVYTIPNGYDEDDFSDAEQSSVNHPEGEIRLVFTGTLYINLYYILIPFFAAIVSVKENNPELYKRIKFQFYGTFPNSYKELIKKYHIQDIFEINDSISLKQIYSKIKSSTGCLLFLNDVYNFALSTKFCEYVSQNKKIIVVSHDGPTANFITSNKLGYWISPQNAYIDFLNCLTKLNTSSVLVEDSKFDVSDFSIKKIVKSVINLIDEPFESTEINNSKKNMLFTFDYELFLGDDSGSVLNSMLKPTELILSSLKKLNLKNALFFVDTLYLYRLQNIETNQTQSDYLSICNQLIQILKNGHFIFPHIHAHWYNANYNKEIDRWSLTDLSLYRFHAANAQQQNHAFEFSMQLIKDIQQKANIFYNIDSYRAGGWCIQPFEGFKPYFIKYGIKNDFSVLKNFSANNPYFYYNFKNFPQQTIYNFEDDISTVTKNGLFKEYSITSISFTNYQNFVNKVFFKIAHKLKYTNYGDGKSVERLNNINIFDEMLEETSQTTETNEMCSIELLTVVKLKSYKQNLNTKSFIHFISHPKMISKHNIYCFENLMQYAIRKFTIETDYKKM